MTYIKNKEYKQIVKSILRNNEFKKLYNIGHHGISRWEHLVKVSYYSYSIAKKLNFDYQCVARGALLHDFYLDGDERNGYIKFLDTFRHPKKALNTSLKLFNINDMEKNIIVSHMFPFFPSLPKYKESVLVDIVDKVIGGYEVINSLGYKAMYKFNYIYILVLLLIRK